MDEVFEELKKQGKNTKEGILAWMKEAKLIDENVKEEDVSKALGDKKDVTMEELTSFLDKAAKGSQETMDSMIAKLCSSQSAMQGAFEKLKQEGKDNVDQIMEWMKNAKLIEQGKESEEKARKFLAEHKERGNIEMNNFMDVVSKAAEEHKERFKDLSDVMAKEMPKMMEVMEKTGAAFKAAFSGGSKEGENK